MDGQALRDHFKFDEAELNANRNGRLSEKQQKELGQHARNISRDISVIGSVFLGIAIIFPIPCLSTTLAAWQSHDIASVSFIVPVLWTLIWGGLGLYFIYCGLFNKSVPEVVIKNVTGPINLVRVERDVAGETAQSYIQHELHIGQEIFIVDGKLASYMTQGDNYVVYFYNVNSSVIKKILSLERLSKG